MPDATPRWYERRWVRHLALAFAASLLASLCQYVAHPVVRTACTVTARFIGGLVLDDVPTAPCCTEGVDGGAL